MDTSGYEEVEWGPIQIRFDACLNTMQHQSFFILSWPNLIINCEFVLFTYEASLAKFWTTFPPSLCFPVHIPLQ
jgi:hypothetical protein